MMLYIFHVDTGKMMAFDMNLALECVTQLKDVIERNCGIPVDKQVLLVSGGESLDPNARVCSYSAGTDTNPIYLFSKNTIESGTPPSLSLELGPADVSLKEQVESSHNMPDTYKTVVARVQLAQQFCERAREQTRACESLVHDQHLQQQGWAAVLANLEDITAAFRARAEHFEQSFKQHLESRAEYIKLLENFREDMDMLARIPVIPALLEGSEDTPVMMTTVGSRSVNATNTEEGEMVVSTKEGVCDTRQQQGDNEVTLLQWISANNQSSLYQVAQLCLRSLEQFDGQVIDSLKTEVDQVLDAAVRTEMKEIKGLEERLYGLEQLMVETKRIVQEQNDLTQSFLSNQTRANNLGDPSILPDLCASHRRQLLVMLANHQHLLDIRMRCTRAKEELCQNLHMRLKWVMYVENMMCDVGNRLMIYHEKLKRLRRHLDVVQQIHLSPQMYVNAVGEVVRRRTFSQAFLMWASDLACQLLAVHNEEVARRKDFQSQFEGHFLNTLFPGMEDLPPPFATQAPSPFDMGLPKLTMEDIERLRNFLPELTFSISGPDLESITQFFLVKSVTGTLKTEEKEETPALEDQLVKVVSDAGLASHLDPTLLQPSEAETSVQPQTPSPISLQGAPPSREQDRGFESETDTEEFEKVGQSPVELVFDTKQGTLEEATCKEAVESAPEEAVQQEQQPLATLEVGVSGGGADSSLTSSSPAPPTPSPSFHHQHPSHQAPPEFATADFYIDESMPSSYTESNSARCQHPVAPELLRQLEDTNTLVALLQENLGNTRNEVERLRSFLGACERVTSDAIGNLRSDLTGIRTHLQGERTEFGRLHAQLLATLSQRLEAEKSLQQEQLHRLTVDHELEMDTLRKDVKVAAENKDEEIRLLKENIEIKEVELVGLRADMESRLEEEVTLRKRQTNALETQLAELRTQLDTAEAEKQKALKEISDRLTHNYKTELEGLRSRFRLMATASMERSPSDSSLEKIERPDMIELVNHEAILAQAREDFRLEKEAAVKAALEEERSRWEARLEMELRQARSRCEAEKQVWFNEAMRRVMGEKDRQLEVLRAREATLLDECQRHRETIRQLTDTVGTPSSTSGSLTYGAGIWPLQDHVEALEAEKAKLQAQLAEERDKKAATDMNTSVAVVNEGTSSSRDAATSPEPLSRHIQEEHSIREKLSRSTTSLIQQGKISISSCNVGDPVLVVWDEEHRNYTILQETSTLYFLHSDSLELLGLRPGSDGSPRRLYSTGEVTEKEYCHAKKSENRYRVPKGTKFYRVKVRPLQRDSSLSRSHHHHHHRQQQSQQQHSSQQQSSVHEESGNALSLEQSVTSQPEEQQQQDTEMAK